jgi:hypothetical protein
LIAHFGSPESARSFAASTVNRSGRAMNHAYALKRLTGQFKPDRAAKTLSASACQWIVLVNQHAALFKLKQNL